MTPITTLVTTGTPGTPVSLANLLADQSPTCAKLLFVAFSGNADAVAIGLSGMNLNTGDNVINDGLKPGDTLSIESHDDDNRVATGLYYFDSQTAGQRILCTQWIG